MFSFFRRTNKNNNNTKENNVTASNNSSAVVAIAAAAAAVVNGDAYNNHKDAVRKEINKRPASIVESDTCPLGPPTCDTKHDAPSCRVDENSSTNVGRREHSTQLATCATSNNVVPPEENHTIMAPMAAFRGKGKGKRKPPVQQEPQQNHATNNTKQDTKTNKQPEQQQQQQQEQQQQDVTKKQDNHQITNNNTKQRTTAATTTKEKPVPEQPPKQPERHKPLSYANILRRLDSVPPMSEKPPEPEKRRHSVKPCSHVTIAASPRIPPPVPVPVTPPGSPIAAIRTARAAKQAKTDSEADTVTAAIKLQIDLPPNKTLNGCESVVNVNGSGNDNDTVVVDDDVTNANERKTVNSATTKKIANYDVITNSNVDSEKVTISIKPDKTNDDDDDNTTRNLVNQETQFQTQLAELTERLRIRDVEASQLRFQMEKLEHDLYAKSSGVDRLQAELTASYKDSELLKQKLKHLQEDVQQYKQKNAEMVEELQKKAEEYKSLEETSKDRTTQLESSLRDVNEKLSNLETQITAIKEERDKLETRRAELETEREEEKRIVQEALDAATFENETIRKRWEQDFEKLRTVNTDREQQMLDDFEWKLREVQATCKKRLDEKDKLTEQRIKDAQKDVDKKIKLAEEQMNEVKHLKSYEAEVTQLRGLTHEQQHSLRTMSVRVDELQTSEQNLREEIARLHGSIEKEKRDQQVLIVKHEKDLADKERQLQIRLEHQRGEVAIQWEQKLRQECGRLTAELEQMHGDEKQLAVELVKVQKDREFETVKEQWERKLQKQLTEINELKTALTKQENKHQTEIERLQTNTDRDIVELRRELDRAEMSYHERIEKILDEHEKQIDRINEEAERKLKELEQNSQMQVSSMRATLELVKEQAVREADERIARLQDEHRRANDELWQRLTDEKEKEIERLEQEYKQKFEKLKEQFTIVQKTHYTKESELRGQIENLRGEIGDRQSSVKCLQGNVDTLHGGMHVLRQEIINQDQLLNRVKIDAEQKISELQHALKVERDTLQVEREEHIEEITHLQKQSQSQIEQLQRRCQCLTKLFEDIRGRYDKRESRSEDLNLIADLRTVIAEQERDLEVLNEEKRYFQMKLMKRNDSLNDDGTPPSETTEWKDGEDGGNSTSISDENESSEQSCSRSRTPSMHSIVEEEIDDVIVEEDEGTINELEQIKELDTTDIKIEEIPG